MTILFVGNFVSPSATGEKPDEVHMSACLEQAGANVTNVDRGEVHAFFTGAKVDNIPEESDYDIILVAKWHHLNTGMLRGLKNRYKGKVVYWVWDYMWKNKTAPTWHTDMVDTADYYISGELNIHSADPRYRYFNWDSSNGNYDQLLPRTESNDVVFTGTYIEGSYRNEILKKVNEKFNLKIFSYDYEVWRKKGFNAEPGKYDHAYNQISQDAKIILCMNWPEISYLTHGYWSNRIGKVMTTGGLPLVHYVPGMERSLSNAPMYFQDEQELMDKIQWLLINPPQRETARIKAYDYGRMHMTTQVRMKEFKLLLESL